MIESGCLRWPIRHNPLSVLRTAAATLALSCAAQAQPPTAAPQPPVQKKTAPPRPAAPKPSKTDDQKKVDEVIQLLEAKLGEPIIDAKIKSFGRAVEVSTDDLIRLKKAGATDGMLLLLMDPSAATPAPPASAPVPAPPPSPPSPPPSAVPPAPINSVKPVAAAMQDLPKAFGLYYLGADGWVSMPQTQCKLQRNKTRALLPNSLVRQKIHANLPGLAAMLRISGTDRPKFLAYFPDRKVSTFTLLRLIPKAEAALREVAQLSVLYSTEQYQDKIEIDISPAGPVNMYFITPRETMTPGEYGVVEPPPTSNSDKVALFDVWDFGIGERAASGSPSGKAK